ncbi:MAG: AAA family ATPase [Bacteroidales bacterium]|nr:AAA family ATPase [Bacteroidales bacterium]
MIFLGEVVTEKEKVVKQEEKDVLPEKNQSNPIEKLNSLIGLNSVKSEIKSLENFLKVQIERDKQGLKQTSLSYHCVFTGNPGTGKTTVARILAEIYKNLGIIERGHLVETDRSGLVAEYVGQTAVKTNKIIDSALDGVLFIDEAYSLAVGSKIDYGNEAIATLLKRMEDNRDRLIVILAGYTDEMKTFIDSNPGLQSRFSRYIEFSDYSAEDLYKIFESKMKEEEYTITDEAKVYLQKFFADSVIHKDRNFGNGRFVRNIFEKVITQQSNRLASLPNLNSKILSEITIDDLK